jgi:hypothetical protein
VIVRSEQPRSGMVATHPSSRYDNSESSLLIDATRKADFPPLSLPKEEFMVRRKQIWESSASQNSNRRNPGMVI